jgi:pimeloyl-ACP methyl ester carboxylesterase
MIKNLARRTTQGAALFAALVLAASCGTDDSAYDAIAQDPVTVDADNPPAIVELNFESHGKRLNGILYAANGSGPHPTVILLHGFPGNEKNLDLAQALRRSGLNVLFFHYRGAWGSEGVYSFTHVIEDVASAIQMLRTRAAEYRVDPEHIYLIGHSLGGFAALQGAARDDSIACVAAIAPVDLGVNAQLFAADEEAAQGFATYSGSAQMLSGLTGTGAVAEIRSNAEDFSLQALAPLLAGRSVLLIAGDKDTDVPPKSHHIPLVAAYSAESEVDLTARVLSGDHSFSWSRIELMHEVLLWVRSCHGE